MKYEFLFISFLWLESVGLDRKKALLDHTQYTLQILDNKIRGVETESMYLQYVPGI